MFDAELIDLVAKMRAVQKRYFKTRSSEDLETSKSLERQADKALAGRNVQPSLFDRAEGRP